MLRVIKIKALLVGIGLLLNCFVRSQQTFVLGNASAHPSAVADFSRSNKGLLIPRMSQSARFQITAPADGLLVYDSTTHRLAQYQDRSWTYFINNTFWTRSASRKFVYCFDSVGIGTSSIGKRLEVAGSIRSRQGVFAENIFAGGMLRATNINASGNLLVNGGALVGGNIISGNSIALNDASPIVQVEVDGQNKVFMQISGDNLRLGTNAGNASGKTIIRMNGTDVLSIDQNSVFEVLSGASSGNFSIGPNLTRYIAPRDNMLPIVSGTINADGTVRSITDNVWPEVTKISPGNYELRFLSARPTGRSAILVTAGGTAPRIATGRYFGPGEGYYTLIQIYDPVSRQFVDTDFSFIIQDPANIYN